MKSADVIFSAERRIGWFACQIFARRKVLICRQDEVATPLVSMMEAADLRQFHHTPEFRWLNHPGLRRIFT